MKKKIKDLAVIGTGLGGKSTLLLSVPPIVELTKLIEKEEAQPKVEITHIDHFNFVEDHRGRSINKGTVEEIVLVDGVEVDRNSFSAITICRFREGKCKPEVIKHFTDAVQRYTSNSDRIARFIDECKFECHVPAWIKEKSNDWKKNCYWEESI